jgi:1-deoxy-D-xylulose-5-phosphate synthase
VVVLVDRAGLVGADGPTHQGLYDIAYLRHLPGFTVAAPADKGELDGMLKLALETGGPWAIRYPRDRAPEANFSDEPVALGRAAVLRRGKQGAILALGASVAPALEAAEKLVGQGIAVSVVSARFAKPVDGECLAWLLAEHPWVMTLEDHTAPGGFGSAALETAEERGLDMRRVHRVAVADRFIEHAGRAAQLAAAGLTAETIAERAKKLAHV